MTDATVDACIDAYADAYPPLIDFEQAAEIAHASINTVRDWSSRALLDGFKSKPGKRCLLIRDEFVRFLMQHRGGG